VLAFEVGTAAERWSDAGHPLLKFMVQTRHPDIDLGGSHSSFINRARRHANIEERMAVNA
jgi:hypothetical protein